jgi:hypothetical protein
MHQIILLQNRAPEIYAANNKQKQKRAASRSFIVTRRVLTRAEGQQPAQEAVQMMKPVPKKKSAPQDAVVAINLGKSELGALVGKKRFI